MRKDSRQGISLRQPVYAIASRDDRLLFVSEVLAGRIAVYDLDKWRADDFKRNPLIGHIPAASGPVDLALSPDGQWLYSTIEEALPSAGLERNCAPETSHQRWHSDGLLVRISVATAATDPRRSLAGVMRAGCNPVRVAVSPGGAYLWVTARDSGAVLRIPASEFGRTTGKLAVSSFDVGGQPVGIAVRPDGKQVWIALSNRFTGVHKQRDVRRQLVGFIGAGNAAAKSVEMVAAAAPDFPRELTFLPDSRTLAVGLFRANRVEFVTTPP